MTNSKLLCTGCKKRYPREAMIKRPVGWFCRLQCSIDYATSKVARQREQLQAKAKQEVKASEKAARAKHRADKERIKPRGQWLKEAQSEFNKYIRLRDAKEPCISCQRHHQGQYHAGHYRTVGAHPELRFNEINCQKQCAPCNNHLSGNLVDYRINLIKKVGLDKVEWLEGPHDPAKLSIEDIKVIKNKYRQLAKG